MKQQRIHFVPYSRGGIFLKCSSEFEGMSQRHLCFPVIRVYTIWMSSSLSSLGFISSVSVGKGVICIQCIRNAGQRKN